MKRKHYFQISLLLILFLLSMICGIASAEEIQSGSHIEINPLYESVISEKDFFVAKASPYSSYSDTFSNISSLQSYIKTQMLNRQANISFTYTGYDMNNYDDAFDWFKTEVLGNGVYLHNGTPNQGDYLLYSVLGWSGNWYGTASKKQFSFNLYYTSTSSQENQLSSVLSSTVSGLKLSGKTDYQKVKAIYDYICSHVTYDYAGLDSGSVNSPQTWSAWKCLVKGTCVCQGYAALFYRMALYAGVDTRIITSYDHAWDITRVGNYYYNLDSTWDAGYSPSQYGYFLKSDKYFEASSSSHVRENNTYTNTNSSYFRSKYPVDPKDYVILNKITLSGASSVETKQTIKLTASFSPLEATNKNVSWSSSNTAAAKVSDSGVVTGVKAGTVTITASSKENPSISAKKTITVTPDDTIYVSKVTISGGTSVVAGEKLTLMATVLPENAENQILKWTSSNTAIAQVSTTGEVTGVKVGTAKITAESTDGSNKKATISITVKPVPVSEVQLTGGSSILVGEKLSLFTTVLPENAGNKTLKWKSSSTGIAKVSAKGEVTGVKPGTATITATAADGSGKSGSITITVKPVLVGSVTMTGGSSVVYGKKLTLKTTVLPKNAANKNLNWTSSDTAIAQVTAKGVVTGIKPGIATITATAADGSGKKAAINITVTPVMVSKVAVSGGSSVLIGGQLNLKSAVTPKNASNTALNWTSSNTAVAQVSTTGVVTGINAGKATITAAATDGSGKSASITITVKPVLVSKITLTGGSSVVAGEKLPLMSTVLPENAGNKTLTWTSSNTTIAQVSTDGVVTGLKSGKAKITATATDGSGKKVAITVTVKPVLVSNVALTGSTSVAIGGQITLKSTISPSNAEKKTLKWASSKSAVAKVSTTGVVTGVKAGTATITATTTDGSGKKASITITVKPKANSVMIRNSAGSVITGTTVQTTESTYQLLAVTNPSEASDNVTWSSGDTSIATVDANGRVTRKTNGTVTITATAADGSKVSGWVKIIFKNNTNPTPIPEYTSDKFYIYRASKVVSSLFADNEITSYYCTEGDDCNKISIYLDDDLDAEVVLSRDLINDNIYYDDIIWETSNNIVTIYEGDGYIYITPKKAGTTKITGTIKNHPELTDSITVTVLNKKRNDSVSSTDNSLLEIQKYQRYIGPVSGSASLIEESSPVSGGDLIVMPGYPIISIDSGLNGFVKVYFKSDLPVYGSHVETTFSDPSKAKVTDIYYEQHDSYSIFRITILPTNIGNTNLAVDFYYDGSVQSTMIGLNVEKESRLAPVGEETEQIENIVISGTEYLYIGDSYQFEVHSAPSNVTNNTVSWSSSDPSVATVSTSGEVKAINIGKTTITAEANNGIKAKGTYKVEVLPFYYNLLSRVITYANNTKTEYKNLGKMPKSFDVPLESGLDFYISVPDALLGYTTVEEINSICYTFDIDKVYMQGNPQQHEGPLYPFYVSTKKSGQATIFCSYEGKQDSFTINIIDGASSQNNSSIEPVVEPNLSNDFVIENDVLVEYNGLDTVVTIPDGVTAIGEYAFSFCDSITQINIPNGVTSIGPYAFSPCKSLTSITIPDSVTSIENHAFSGCSELKQVVLSKNIKAIDYFAFADCNSLETVNIPGSLTELDLSAFMSSKTLNFENDFRNINIILDRFYQFSIMTDAYGNFMYNPDLNLCYNNGCYGVSNPNSAAKSSPAKMPSAVGNEVPMEDIVTSFENKEASLAIGEKTILNYTLSSGTEAFIASSDETVVSVDSVTHEITAVNAGTAMVYLSSMNPVEILDTCVITVTEAGEEIPDSVPANGFTDKSLTLEIGEKTVLSYAVTDGTDVFMGSTDESVVTVDGITHEITAQKAGRADIYLSGLNPVEILDMCAVTVTEPEIVAADEPITEPEVEVTAEPTAEPEAETTAEPTAELEVEATAEPTAEPEVEVTEESIPEPVVEVTEESAVEETPEATEEPIVLVTELDFDLSEIRDDVLEMTEEDVLEIGWDKVIIRPDGKTYEDVEFRSDNESSLKLEVKGDGIRLTALTEGEGELILKAKEGDVEKKITFIVHPVVKPEPEAAIVPETAAVE